MSSTVRYIRVGITGPLCRSFTYVLPGEFTAPNPGQRVVVPFGRRSIVGYYLGQADPIPGVTIKPVQKLLDYTTLISLELFALCQWISEYYVANPADCLSLALPTLLRNRVTARLMWADEAGSDIPDTARQLMRPGKTVTDKELTFLKSRHKVSLPDLISRGIVREIWPVPTKDSRASVSGYRVNCEDGWPEFVARRKQKPEPFDGERTRQELLALGWTGHLLSAAVKAGVIAPVTRSASDKLLDVITARPEVRTHSMTSAQQDVLARVAEALTKGFATFLLHGITGSGKTLVYCHLAEEVLAQGKTVLMLTPEIALAGAMMGYVRGYFGDQVTILHSGMSERARLENWQAIRAGKHPIVVGPRSALFAPLPNLGLIIVDEEHDGSYKQDDPAPRFHARDAAIKRGQINNVPVLLGSASPSVESYYQAKSGKYQLLELNERPAGAKLPVVRVVDLRQDRLGGDLPFISYALKKEVEKRFDRQEQVILFLNRRGYSAMLKCGACGHVPQCPQCEVHMTYHKAGGGRLACHYCGLVRRPYPTCEKCNGHDFLFLGAGTQKLEESISRLFDRAVPLRFDSDTTSGDLGAHRLLSSFASQKFNLLLGTQMVTKGLDMPGVSLVGVLSADHGLDLPDFRASEKTFARLLQVAGRSGRTEREGEVIIQTYYPENEVIIDAARQDYRGFFAREIVLRQEHDFPPFVRLLNIELLGAAEEQVKREAESLRHRLEEKCRAEGVAAGFLGPAPCPHYYLKGVYRRHLLVKSKRMPQLSRLLAAWDNEQARFGLPAAIKVRLDVDPVDMM
jgi:primosomal protein N' (replication factor Y) (superfamily II helicase)